MLLWLALMAFPSADSTEITPGFDFIKIGNSSASPISIGFKTPDLVAADYQLGGLQSADAWTQCAKKLKKDGTRLSLFGHSADDAQPDAARDDSADGAALVYVADTLDHRTDVGRILKKAEGDWRSIPFDLRGYPAVFSVLQSASIVLLTGIQWAGLSDEQKRVTKLAIAGGLNLVVTAPFSQEAAESLRRSFGVTFEGRVRPETVDLGQGRVELSHYALNLKSFDGSLLQAKKRVVAAYKAIGLGQLRLVGLPLQPLAGSQLAAAILESERAAVRMAEEWLVNNHSIETERRNPLGLWPWFAVLGLGVFAILARRRLVIFSVGVCIWAAVSLCLPSTDDVLIGDAATSIIVSADDTQQIALTRVSSVSIRGGDSVVDYSGGHSSLISARGAQICLLGLADTRIWFVKSNASARQTFTIAHSVPAAEYGEDRLETIDGQVGTPFEGAIIRRVRKAVPLPLKMPIKDHRVVALQRTLNP
ncbi:MAG: hypothetical protein VYA30_09715 [Myxococcota bacterium]|nr:hypothetical protein [Myxococcota bacterium]